MPNEIALSFKRRRLQRRLMGNFRTMSQFRLRHRKSNWSLTAHSLMVNSNRNPIEKLIVTTVINTKT